MREIRTLRAMWRVLETELRNLLTGHEGGNAGYRQGVSFEFVAPALDPTNCRHRPAACLFVDGGARNDRSGYSWRHVQRC